MKRLKIWMTVIGIGAVYGLFTPGSLLVKPAWADSTGGGLTPAASVKPADEKASEGIAKIRDLPPELADKLSSKQIEHILVGRVSAPDGPTEYLVPLFFFICVLGIVGGGLYQGYRREKERQETLRLAIEKGAVIPPELMQPPPRKSPRSDLRKGILLIATGLGLVPILVLVTHPHNGWAIGLLPALIGVGYLVVWKLERRPNV